LRPIPPTLMKSPSPSPAPLRLPVLAELIARGDGTYVLKPRVPETELETWLTVPEAAQVIGHVGRKTIYRWLEEGYLVYRRVLRSRLLVSLESARAMRHATLDPEFWYDPRLKQRLRDRVQAAMDRLARQSSPGPGG
jgi:excisionase family DNA binding protein